MKASSSSAGNAFGLLERHQSPDNPHSRLYAPNTKPHLPLPSSSWIISSLVILLCQNNWSNASRMSTTCSFRREMEFLFISNQSFCFLSNYFKKIKQNCCGFFPFPPRVTEESAFVAHRDCWLCILCMFNPFSKLSVEPSKRLRVFWGCLVSPLSQVMLAQLLPFIELISWFIPWHCEPCIVLAELHL